MYTKAFTPLLIPAAAAALLSLAATAQARTPVPQTTPASSSSSMANPSNINGSATFKAKNGAMVTVKSYQPSSEKVAPPPAFSSLDSNGNGSISPAEAAAYPPLANDFNYADGNHNGAISKAEYKRWVNQP